MSRTRMTTLPFLLFALSAFVMSDSDYPLISCPLCKSKTKQTIHMKCQDLFSLKVEKNKLRLSSTTNFAWHFMGYICSQPRITSKHFSASFDLLRFHSKTLWDIFMILQGSSWLRNLGRSDFSLQTKQGEVL